MAVTTQAISIPTREFEAATPGERLRRGGGWLAAILIVVMLCSVAWSVQAAEWSEGLNLIQAAVTAGAVAGLLLALTSWGSFFSGIYSLLTCVAVVITLLTRGFLHSESLNAGIIEFAQRATTWSQHLAKGQPAGDNLIFVAQLLILGWWMGHFAAWTIMRHQNAWLAALPAGVALMFNAYYSPRHLTGYLLLFLMMLLLLAIRVELARNETRWQLANIRYASDIYLDFLRDGFIFAVVIVALTWLAPAGQADSRWADLFKPVQNQWHDLQQNFNRAYTNLRYPQRVVVTTFGKSLTLGGAVHLTDRPIFQAQAPDRVYWQAAAFDTYNGSQWVNSDSQTMQLDRNKPLPEPDYLLSHEITATVRTLEQGQDVLFSPPHPVQASLPVSIDYNPLVAGDTAPVGYQHGFNVSVVRSRGVLPAASVYQVTARTSDAPPDLLRVDKEPYPDGIKQRYLQVPPELPDRVRRLAQQITAPYDNPYDKAAAIEAYVRSFPYNNQITAPPSGTDGVDYFLYDVKQGYCDYYASAMAIMLRVVGIPTRFVVGYSPGNSTGDDPTQTVVLEENAHAWPEVFFPQYGWVQFEPTASQPMLDRPAPIAPATPAPEVTPDPEQRDKPFAENPEDLQAQGGAVSVVMRNPVARWIVDHRFQALGGAAGILLLAAALIITRRRRRRLLMPDEGLLARLFARLSDWARRLRVPWPASNTPLEHARALGAAVPEAAPPADRLAHLFVAQQYGRQELDSTALTGAAGDWRALQPVLWRNWLRRMIPKIDLRRLRRRRPAAAEGYGGLRRP